MEEERARFRMRIAGTTLRQQEIAAAMGKSAAWLSMILNGPRPIPEGFEAELEAGITAATERRRAMLDASEATNQPARNIVAV